MLHYAESNGDQRSTSSADLSVSAIWLLQVALLNNIASIIKLLVISVHNKDHKYLTIRWTTQASGKM